MAIFGPRQALAHGQGLSLISTSTPYLIDVGYPSPFTSKEPVLFDFLLRDLVSSELSSYKYVWVRIKQDGKTLLATGVTHQSLGPTSLLYTFVEVGTYELNVSFRNDEGVLSEATFPITVAKSSSDSAGFDFMRALYLLIAVAIGATGSLIFSRRKK